MGYPLVPQSQLEKNSEEILRWLNNYSLNQSILNFPEDIIENHGLQLFETISFLSGKNLNFNAKIDLDMKKSEKIEIILRQYENLIKYLKENGALLNTIRPYYLLSFILMKKYANYDRKIYIQLAVVLDSTLNLKDENIRKSVDSRIIDQRNVLTKELELLKNDHDYNSNLFYCYFS